MKKNDYASTPPMGWNSWDCYGASVTEEQIRGNADYMEKHLKAYGWEYVVCDIQWYEPTASSTIYHNFADLEMDGYGRLLPAANRFPSAEGGNGFKPLADYIHGLGLQFGIHIMRGIPRQAVHRDLPVKGTKVTARAIAQSYSICSWNTDMYGVDASASGAQAYYDSIFELYAQWGIDFVKVDDICVTYFQPDNLYSAREEIELIRNAIDHCGRPMVLSLSPGAALVTEHEHLAENANMWRITNDFWDRWDDIMEMFWRCNDWSPYVKEGCWPDCDMLPIGHISICGNEHGVGERYTNFSKEEQVTLMTLWSFFRSPLMLGCELRDNDAWTLELITNQEVLALLKVTFGAHQVFNCGGLIVWQSQDIDNNIYIAMFNTRNTDGQFEVTFDKLKLQGSYSIRDLWAQNDIGSEEKIIETMIPSHGAKLFKLVK